MARRGDADPLLLHTVSRRLAGLLAETSARAASESLTRPAAEALPPAAATGGEAAEPAAGPTLLPGARRPLLAEAVPLPDADDTRTVLAAAGPELLDVEEVPPPRRFSRRHLAVVAVLVLAGLLWAGWTLLRARPVALATPVVVSAAPAATPEQPIPGPAPPAAPATSGAPPASGPASAGGAPSPTAAPPTGAAAASPAAAGTVVVHVLGAVRRPGLVTLREPARVQDAVDAAGGLRHEADPAELNLAQLLVDGQQVVIGTERKPTGEVRGNGGAPEAGAAGSGGAGTSAGPPGSGAALDLNRATAAELEDLPGVGPVTAAKIASWREQHGRFSRVEELQEVDGIGPKTYAEIAPHVRV